MSKNIALKCQNIYTALTPELVDGYVVIENNIIRQILHCDDVKLDSSLLRDTEVFDYSENFIMPGLFDFHTHLLSGAMLERDGVLRYTESQEEAARFLWDKHKDNRGKNWILGGAWDPILWKGDKDPSKEILDKYFPDTPVFLVNKECHGAWVNSKLFETFGITKDTPNPPNGHYSRTENGNLRGYVHEEAFANIQNQIYERMSNKELADYATSSIELANSYGITSVGEVAGVGPMKQVAYDILHKEERLNVRVVFYPLMENGVDFVKNQMTHYSGNMLRCGGAKTFIDGTPQGYTGFMIESFSDMPGNKGRPLIEPALFTEQIIDFHKQGIPVRVHACGDAGVRLSLDAFEEAINITGEKNVRHSIEHIESVSPDDIPRFGKLGVIASVQPEHMPKYDFDNHPFHQILGEERMKYCWPFESMRNNGATLAFGTDYPVVDITPFKGIFRAVTRLTNEEKPKGGWNSSERLSVHEALRAYCYGGAYASGRDDEIGTIEVGKLADIAVIEKNLFKCAADLKSMFNMNVLLTMVNGRIVHQK